MSEPKGATVLHTNSVAYQALHKIDSGFVGTPDYMGLAYFWSYEYRYPMRDLPARARVEAHDAIVAAELDPSGESNAHARIMERIERKYRRHLERRFGPRARA